MLIPHLQRSVVVVQVPGVTQLHKASVASPQAVNVVAPLVLSWMTIRRVGDLRISNRTAAVPNEQFLSAIKAAVLMLIFPFTPSPLPRQVGVHRVPLRSLLE